MAAELGEKLLSEVHEERLDELLHDLRTIYENVEDAVPLNRPLGVTEIDDLLDVFMQGNSVPPAQQPPVVAPLEESAPAPDDGDDGEYAHKPENEDVKDEIPMDPQDPPSSTRISRNPVLEISSTSSAAGKTQVLYHLAALAVLPSTFADTRLGGHDSAVVFLDTDGRFDASRLQTIARGIVHDRLPPSAGLSLSTPAIESMLSSSLHHVHVFRPHSSSALLATLKHLESYLYDLPRHVSASRPLHAIFIDSAGAFFWQDKLHDEVARTEDIGRPRAEIEHERVNMQSFYLGDLYAELVARLRDLQRVFGCMVVFTTTAWSARSMSTAEAYRPSGPFELYNPLEELGSGFGSGHQGPAFRSPLPPPWGVFPDLRLVVQRDRVRGFLSSMTPAAARGEQARLRREVVVQGRFLVWVNGWGREEWPRRVREGLERRNGGVFGFRVTGDGVRFT